MFCKIVCIILQDLLYLNKGIASYAKGNPRTIFRFER